MVDLVHPEDNGVNSNLVNDWVDAAIVGQMVYGFDEDDVVIDGLNFTADFGVPDLDISAGSAKIAVSGESTVDHSNQTPAISSKTLNTSTLVCDLDARTGLSLTDNATNHVFIDVDRTSQDSASITINTTNSAPSEPQMKLGQVDTSGNTSRETNRGPVDTGSIDFSNSPLTITHSIGTKNFSSAQFYDDTDTPIVVEWTADNPDEITVDANTTVTGSYSLRR